VSHQFTSGRVVFFYNSDYSGDVGIDSGFNEDVIGIPFADLRAFFCQYLRDMVVDEIEGADDDAIIAKVLR